MNKYCINILLFTNLLNDGFSAFLGPQSDQNPVGDEASVRAMKEGATSFLHEFAELREYTGKHYTRYVGNCPPSIIELESGDKIPFGKKKKFITEGSGSHVYVVDNYIIKFIYAYPRWVVETLAEDHAFMKIYNGENGIPKVHELGNTVPPACAVRLLISDKAGSWQIAHLAKVNLPHLWQKQVYLFEAGAQALETLKAVHSRGLIHGDIHYQNFVCDINPEREEIKVRLIDFGRAEPFVNPGDGTHVTEEKKEYLSYLAWHLSPWELEGWRKTRRDDLFRLAETLLRSGRYDTLFDKKERRFRNRGWKLWQDADAKYIRKALQYKKNRPFSNEVPQILIDFYQATLNLGFAETINYDEWINRFRTESQDVKKNKTPKVRTVFEPPIESKGLLESVTAGLSNFGKSIKSVLSGLFG